MRIISIKEQIETILIKKVKELLRNGAEYYYNSEHTINEIERKLWLKAASRQFDEAREAKKVLDYINKEV